MKENQGGLNNLYIKDLSKIYSNDRVRRAFALYGKISSFSLINKPEF